MPRFRIICIHVAVVGIWATACAAQDPAPRSDRFLDAPAAQLWVDGVGSDTPAFPIQGAAHATNEEPARLSPPGRAGAKAMYTAGQEGAAPPGDSHGQASLEPLEQGTDATRYRSQGDAAANSPRSIVLPQRSAPDAVSLAPRGSADSSLAAKTIPSFATVFSSLAIVVGLFLVVAWVMRRKLGGDALSVPTDVVNLLGRLELPGRHQLQLIRCGSKLLLLSVSAGAAETLTEITDPIEVDRLAGLCQQRDSRSSTFVFGQVLGQFGKESSDKGFAASEADSTFDPRKSSIRAHNSIPESSDA